MAHQGLRRPASRALVWWRKYSPSAPRCRGAWRHSRRPASQHHGPWNRPRALPPRPQPRPPRHPVRAPRLIRHRDRNRRCGWLKPARATAEKSSFRFGYRRRAHPTKPRPRLRLLVTRRQRPPSATPRGEKPLQRKLSFAPRLPGKQPTRPGRPYCAGTSPQSRRAMLPKPRRRQKAPDARSRQVILRGT